jgi:hypothetical protein
MTQRTRLSKIVISAGLAAVVLGSAGVAVAGTAPQGEDQQPGTPRTALKWDYIRVP